MITIFIAEQKWQTEYKQKHCLHFQTFLKKSFTKDYLKNLSVRSGIMNYFWVVKIEV